MLKRYPIRVVKYFLFLSVLFVVLIGILLAMGQTSPEKLYYVFSNQYWVPLLLFVGLPLAYPLFGYTAHEVRGNLEDKRGAIEKALIMSGFRITTTEPERLIARGASTIKKLSLFFEDRIEVTAEGNHFVRIEGPRREVVRIEARIRAAL
jgi:hypothetical protein